MEHVKSVVFYDPNADYGERGKIYRAVNRVYTYTLLIAMGICIGILSLMIVCEYMNVSGLAIFKSYMQSPWIPFLNILPAVLLILFVYFISGRAWIAYPVSAFLVLGASVGDYAKLMLRTEPFVASELGLLAEAGNMMTRYTIDYSWRLAAMIAALILGTAFAAIFMRTPYKNIKVRVLLTVVLIAACAFLYTVVYSSDETYNSVENVKFEELGFSRWTKEHKYISCGFLYPFIHSIKDAFPSPPEGYSEKLADQLISKYTSDDIEDGKKVNVISVMLEAYSDLSRFEILDIADGVYAPIHRVFDESYSGVLISNTFGGGTIDSERTFLTGYTNIEDYSKSVNSYVRYFNDQGYFTCGFHAGDGWFYNRKNVNEYIGFSEYDFIETVEGSDRTDSFFFDHLRSQYEKRDKTTPYFSYNLTFQNHGPYDSSATSETKYVDNSGLSDYSYNVLNNYLIGVADTSARIENFVNSFKDDEEPVIIIMFGDHMPWMGDNNKVLNELGINLNTGTEEGFYNYYSTMYFIWANDAAKEVLGNDFTGEGEPISACFLMPKLFELCSWGGNELSKAASEMYKNVTVVNTGSGMYRENGEIKAELSESAAAALSDYRMMQYRIMHKKVS